MLIYSNKQILTQMQCSKENLTNYLMQLNLDEDNENQHEYKKNFTS